MSLSRHLQSPEILSHLRGMTPSELRTLLIERGNDWYSQNASESTLIHKNLVSCGLDATEMAVRAVQEHTILHYYEKLLPLTGDPAFYANYIATSIDMADAQAQLSTALADGGVLLAVAHFGAVELIPPAVASLKMVPVNPVLRFTTQALSDMAHFQSDAMAASGLFSHVNFIEIGRPGTVAAMDMTAALRRGEVLLTVFDEETPYSIDVPLFKKTVKGGAGLQNLVKFARTPLTVFAAFMIRTGTDRYWLKLCRIDSEAPVVSGLYTHLEETVREYPEQWYFLHEEIPFVT